MCRVGQSVWELFHIHPRLVTVTRRYGGMLPRIARQSGTQHFADTEDKTSSSLVVVVVVVVRVFTMFIFDISCFLPCCHLSPDVFHLSIFHSLDSSTTSCFSSGPSASTSNIITKMCETSCVHGLGFSANIVYLDQHCGKGKLKMLTFFSYK